nr:PREDICTED: sodium-dependent phosphate transporter 1-B [Bemisia tabaci]
MEPFSPDLLWLVIVSAATAFLLSFGIGANDVANSFGTSVGSKVLSIRNACILATIFEIAGAILVGYRVSDTMRKGILEIEVYNNSEKELMAGCLSSLAGSGIWLIVATFFNLPISGTHSIVGATVGFSFVARGAAGIHWGTLGTIVASWFISPVLSGIVSVLLFVLIRRFIIKAPQPMNTGLRVLPYIYGLTVAVNVVSIIHDGPKLLHLDQVPAWEAVAISGLCGLIIGILVKLFVAPRLRKRILEQLNADAHRRDVKFTICESTDSSRDTSPRTSRLYQESDVNIKPLPIIKEENSNIRKSNGFAPTNQGKKNSDCQLLKCRLTNAHETSLSHERGHASPADGLTPNSSAVPLLKEKPLELLELEQCSTEALNSQRDPPEVARIFSFLQILTAIFGSFAHGGNDVSNAIGPLIAIWMIYSEGSVEQKAETPIYILLYGGIGISCGLWIWGRRVIKTIGEDLTKITPSTGFTIEIGAAFTVLLASKVGLPISTTHCKVGSVVFVGWVSSSKAEGVDWKLFRNIIYAWVVTIPVAGGLSAAIMFILKHAYL